MAIDPLVAIAWRYRENAYAPYSKFKVGAAIETIGGQVFGGCNVEVANFGCTLCAERAAIVAAVCAGALAPGGLARVAVAAVTARPTAPCGSCRQMVEEFANEETVVLMSNEPGRVSLIEKHAKLLPYSFNKSDFI